jgi:streptogramin lyase
MTSQIWRRTMLAASIATAVVAGLASVAQATSIREFALPSGSDPFAIASGPDGNLWATDAGAKALWRITPSGGLTKFTTGLNHGYPADITAGPDGNLWFTELNGMTNAIGRITPNGTITEYPIQGSSDTITVGPDNNIWFLDGGVEKIGRVIPSTGQVDEFGMPNGLMAGAHLNALAAGPDGNLWFTDQGGSPPRIGKITPTGAITEFPDMTLKLPTDITAGADGNVWFTDNNADVVGRITPSGTYTFLGMGNGLQTNGTPDGITLGPDGNIWFTDALSSNPRMLGKADITVGADGNLWIEQANDNTPGSTGSIARITPSGTVTEFTNGLLPNANNDGDHLEAGPDGNLWFNDRGAKAIGKVSLELPPTASTGAASAITTSSATVSGSVEPFGAPTAVTFRYGTTPALGSTISAGILQASTNSLPVTATLSGLPPATTIYYEVVADNGSATVSGGVKTFTTAVPPIQSTTATLGNQQFTLMTPSPLICTARAKTLSATLTSTAIPHSRRAKLRFARATVSIDKGIRHTRRRVLHLAHGRKRTVTVVVYTPNATVRHVPATVKLRLAGLRPGMHTLKVTLSYKETLTLKHNRHTTVTVTKTISARFRVC